MAIYTRSLYGNFDETLRLIHDGILNGSFSASYEDGSDSDLNGVRCAVRVYERYSMFGGNRLSLNVTLFGKDGEMFLTAITSGGSQAVLFKVNTLGEDAFLNRLIELFE